MAASATAQRGAALNLSDIPEMLPGARPGANPAQREEFEKRSRMLHYDEVEEETQKVAQTRAAAGHGPSSSMSCKDLEEMFPMLDAALVRSLRAEAPSAQHAIETLLALAGSCAEPVGGAAAGAEAGPVKELPPFKLGVEDHTKFPSLIDADGWQLPNPRLEEVDKEKGSVWRDRANAAKDKPAPKAKVEPVAWGPKKKQGRQKGEEEEEEKVQPYTDYECRHRAGERRAKQRVQYSRGRGSGLSGRGRGRGAAAGTGEEETEESEEEFDITDV